MPLLWLQDRGEAVNALKFFLSLSEQATAQSDSMASVHCAVGILLCRLDCSASARDAAKVGERLEELWGEVERLSRHGGSDALLADACELAMRWQAITKPSLVSSPELAALARQSSQGKPAQLQRRATLNAEEQMLQLRGEADGH